MAVKIEDVVEVIAMAVSLCVLLGITFALNNGGMFRPIRPARVPLRPFLAAIRPVSRRSNAENTQRDVVSALRAVGIVQPTSENTGGVASMPTDTSLSSGEGADSTEAEPFVTRAGNLVAVHFGHVQGGEEGARASSAGVVLVAGEDAVSSRSVSYWRQRLANCVGLNVEAIECTTPGLEIAHFPWHGWLAKLIVRYRVLRHLGLRVERELRPRKQLSPSFLEIVSPLDNDITLHVFLTPALRSLREPHGLPLRPDVG